MTRKKAYHGGAFFKAIGNDFATLDKSKEIISADVLDPWFGPSPKAIAKIQNHLPFIIKTSPPTQCEGLIKTIAEVRYIPEENILVGGGSSDIMFTILPRLVESKSKVLILDPMYGEYAHIFENVTESKLYRHMLKRENNFQVVGEGLMSEIEDVEPDFVILVNPNSPTGQFQDALDYLELVKKYSNITFIIDETYIEYIGTQWSVESEAVKNENLIVIKSMSKMYALSGVRVAYMVAHKKLIDELATFFPPWSVSLIGQIAGVEALKDPEYYSKKYEETHDLRKKMEKMLASIEGIRVYEGVANFILIELLHKHVRADSIVAQLRKKDIYIRNCTSMSTQLGDKFVRITVKDNETNKRVVNELRKSVNVMK